MKWVCPGFVVHGYRVRRKKREIYNGFLLFLLHFAPFSHSPPPPGTFRQGRAGGSPLDWPLTVYSAGGSMIGDRLQHPADDTLNNHKLRRFSGPELGGIRIKGRGAGGYHRAQTLTIRPWARKG
jgi:hypothetical protein